MGRSAASSCFKIITCGSDSVDPDDLQATDSNDSSDRRGWSFRKKSARPRVLNNTVISGVPSLNKASSESATVSFQSQPKLTSPEKTSLIQLTEEKIEFPAQVNSKLLDTTADREDNTVVKGIPEDSTVIAIQAAIRGFLAKRLLLKHKNIIKLQAAVRGHIVRKHAVGTLRCVHAIIKMQILVRARRARQLLEGSLGKENNDHGIDGHIPKLMGSKGEDKQPVTCTSIEKLLRNRFARQLMESTSRTKTINIKCDPSKSDGAWKWLELWMSVSSMSNEEALESELAAEQHKQNCGFSVTQEEIAVPSESYSESKDLKPGEGASSGTSENDDNLITYNAENLDLQANKSTPPSSSHICEQSQSQNIDESNSRYNTSESLPIQTKESDLISEVEHKSFPGKAETENEDMLAAQGFPPEQPETDVKKLSFSSKKASNPAFIAAQSKFKELSSATNSAKLTSLSNQHHGVEHKVDKSFSVTDQTLGTREMDLAGNSVSHASVVQIGGSECGTELSISSTLDSPDRSEVGVIEFEQVQKVSDGTDHPKINENVEIETNGKSSIPATDLSYTKSDQLDRLDNANHVNGESDNSMNAADSSQVKEKPDTDPIDMQLELESEASQLAAYKSSPEASPRSHISVSESHATPSSQKSVNPNPKKLKNAKGESNLKRRSSSVDKKSPSNNNLDSGARNSLEHLPKDHKTGKRRNSYGATKPDNVDQEPRDSGSSNSVPSYMQATESARAKAIANSSPRSSPDVQDMDYTKKRHSLPGANGRQGSPRIERSVSQTQQGIKGNGMNSPQDRKWRR